MEKGALATIIEQTRESKGCSLNSLTVLSSAKDPYRLDTPANHRKGEWLGEQLARLIGDRKIHWRGLHYAIVSAGDIRKPDGEIFRNTDDDWLWLCAAGKAARWLDYIDFDAIIDNRNSEPVIHRFQQTEPRGVVLAGIKLEVPDVEDLEPYPCALGFEPRQPFALSIFGEKTSLEDALLPLAQRFEADLYLPAGEISDTLLARMAKDGAADGRKLVVFVLSDCDPAGYQMAVSIARKFQSLRDFKHPELEFEIVPVALTVQQVRELGLPSTPLKSTERRAGRWREAFGVEQTEIDALATLRPGVLQELVTTAIEPYFDRSLAGRVNAYRLAWESKAQQWIDEQIGEEVLQELRQRAEQVVSELESKVREVEQNIAAAMDGQIVLPPIDLPQPQIIGAPQGVLISSDMSWAEATRILIERKSYGEDSA